MGSSSPEHVAAARLSIPQLHLLTHEDVITKSEFPSHLQRSFSVVVQREFIEHLLQADLFNSLDSPTSSLVNMIKKYNIYLKQIHLEFPPKQTE